MDFVEGPNISLVYTPNILLSMYHNAEPAMDTAIIQAGLTIEFIRLLRVFDIKLIAVNVTAFGEAPLQVLCVTSS
ncbi:unnamed protein product, partial [marine sediment metagenome]